MGRRVLKEGIPKKQVARETGIGRRTIEKMLTHKHPPGYSPRLPNYPKLGPYIPAIDRLHQNAISSPLAADLTIQNIVDHLRREEGFAGSYDSVRKYLRRRALDDERTWGRVCELIIQLPKPQAIEFVRLLSQGNLPKFSSLRLRPYVREAKCPHKPSSSWNIERKQGADIDWMRRLLQKEIKTDTLHGDLDDIRDISVLLQYLHNGRLADRNRAMVILASRRRIPSKTICAFLGVGKAFVRKYRNKYECDGFISVFAPQTKSN